jgi:hypothetical protein
MLLLIAEYYGILIALAVASAFFFAYVKIANKIK